MTGAITNIEALERWFRGNGNPYFTLKYAGPGERVIFRNEALEDLETAWEELRHQIESQASAGRAFLEVLSYAKGKNNHALRTNVDIRNIGAPSAGISGLPIGIGNVSELVDMKVRLAMLERDNEDLQYQISSPNNTLERIIEKISESPHLAGLVQMGMAALLKVNPSIGVQQPVTGYDSDNTGSVPNETQQFEQNILQTSQMLGVDHITLAARLKRLVEKNPEVARQLLQNEA